MYKDPTENLLFAAMENIKVYRRIHPWTLAALLSVEEGYVYALVDTLLIRNVITKNRDGTVSPRPQGDGLKHPQDFTPVEGRRKRKPETVLC